MLPGNAPKLDLHGEVVDMVNVLVRQFINDNKLMKNEYVVIIHGKSTNILTKEVHNVLKKNKDVLEYYLNNWNLGETIVKININ